ncbi:hypothetical protein AXF42_Ash003740 [Apostasia shenzhenica]|uniref:Uncharacterized protein n=1 Tax=Apostasia shenzhenica TaxID=1088818 RepID=A0A2I0AHS3_9ASPA|nr:hypothetical protein AXF42_Ash003740 [Apostasia shenzhenica]
MADGAILADSYAQKADILMRWYTGWSSRRAVPFRCLIKFSRGLASYAVRRGNFIPSLRSAFVGLLESKPDC